MFLASALKRGRHPPENIMKFNVPGGECLSLGHLLRTWPPAISVSETSVCTYSVPRAYSRKFTVFILDAILKLMSTD